MDINAGSYLDGVSMDDLGKEALDYLVDVASENCRLASGRDMLRFQLWRNWSQTGEVRA